ncbi:MAG: hypothetical protein J7L39_00820 [Candidatus Aenigmarchaeota archaeon]|nr:hypothetical protein [Candidatus Aenigmarchaeota archaeon]
MQKFGNFWLIWISCAGKKKSLYQIQKMWGIKTNYLYHPEKSLNKPMFKLMLDEGYIRKEGKYLTADFYWVKEYIVLNYKGSLMEKYVDAFLGFLRDKKEIFFNPDNILLLFRGNPSLLKRYGRNIFSYIFLYLLYRDFREIAKIYKAEYIARIFRVFLEFTSEINLKGYFDRIDEKLIEYSPTIVKTMEDWITLSKI